MKKSTYKGSKATAKALNTYVKLMRAAESLTTRIHRNLTEVNLTISQFGTLEALYHLGPMTQVEIGTKILKSSGNMTLVIDNLEKRGLVRRERSKEDRRYFTVHLTDAGKKLVCEFFPAHAGRIAAEMGVLTPSEQEQLGWFCKKIGTRKGGGINEG
ncbi:MAG: transcriptional regulator, MarR family [Deltaproteobacteria bacterium]|jgi:MarR family 2-MHQ and catechol resistance regulon transcriptional repressor|nr:transcriptional regulator, MarR family [Deltaproteobacteria bacterium]